jgi:hypothetical protein
MSGERLTSKRLQLPPPLRGREELSPASATSYRELNGIEMNRDGIGSRLRANPTTHSSRTNYGGARPDPGKLVQET